MNTDYNNQCDPQQEERSNGKLKEIISRLFVDTIWPKIQGIKDEIYKVIGKLRSETYELKTQLQEAQERVDVLESYIISELREKLKDNDKNTILKQKEAKAAVFLSGDGGLLFNLSDMVVQASMCMSASDSAAKSKEIQRFIGHYLWPTANRLVIFDKPVPPVSINLDADLSLNQLMQMHRDTCKQVVATPNLDLMHDMLPLLREMSSHDFEERLDNIPAHDAASLILANTNGLIKIVEKHGIGVFDAPTPDTIQYFSLPKDGESVRPLVMRIADNLVYTPGVSAEADPDKSLY